MTKQILLPKIRRLLKVIFNLSVTLTLTILLSFFLMFYIIYKESKYIDKITNLQEEINTKDSLYSVKEQYFREMIAEANKKYQDAVVDYKLEIKKNLELYKLNWENIDFWIKHFDIKHPEIVKAQIALETANLTSYVCLHNKNLFGMRHNNRISIKNKNNHAFYENYIESIYDYKMWQEKYYKNPNENYFKFLQRIGYAEDKNYINKLKFIIKTVKL